jgi:hypothetical protein
MKTTYATWHNSAEFATVTAAVQALDSAEDYVIALDGDIPRRLNAAELQEEVEAKQAQIERRGLFNRSQQS